MSPKFSDPPQVSQSWPSEQVWNFGWICRLLNPFVFAIRLLKRFFLAICVSGSRQGEEQNVTAVRNCRRSRLGHADKEKTVLNLRQGGLMPTHRAIQCPDPTINLPATNATRQSFWHSENVI